MPFYYPKCSYSQVKIEKFSKFWKINLDQIKNKLGRKMTLKDTVDTEDPKTSISKDEMIGYFSQIQKTSSLPKSVN